MAPDGEVTWQPSLGLALGGGLARGFAHIGVLRALEKYGIRPDLIAGTSIGAVVGAAYLAGKLDVMEDWARSLNRFRILSYLDFRMNAGGMINGARLMATLEKHLGKLNFEDLDRPFIAIATDLGTGHEVWLKHGPLVPALRASFSLPGVFPPILMGRRWLVDGALVNPVPVAACQAMEAQMTIAVNLNADAIGSARRNGARIQTVAGFDLLEQDHEAAERARKTPFWRRIFQREPDHPSLFGVMFSSLNILQHRIARSRLAGDPPDITIDPHIGHIGLAEFDRAEEVIDEGARAVERHIDSICDALAVLGRPVPRNFPKGDKR
ncbi:MAG TPA: patatin-like phospholipase family protein [Alphaproteobacteria bacterium]|nr:patatin-like phospholipase family protein [Alphaproteobacteria bacterium]